jgi:nicotinate-nucleotide--dimethylbenzimidazole phosphoribosyltransferase
VPHQLDKHGLDVALSAGRHAAERAKLAGVGRLIAMAPSLCPAAAWQLPITAADGGHTVRQLPCPDWSLYNAIACFDFYDALLCRGRSEIAALVGIAIAAAQMGIPFCLPDSAGGVAVEAAVGLNPGVRAWLESMLAERPGSVPSPVSPRAPCAV